MASRRQPRRPSNADLAALVMPSSLRIVNPFLEEAQSRLRDEKKANCKIVVHILDHAFDLVRKFRIKLDEDSRIMLDMFRTKRNAVADLHGIQRITEAEMSVTGENEVDGQKCTSSSTRQLSADDILIGEAMSTLALADEEYSEGEIEAAARNYHTATVYFRVLESMVPRLTPKVHASLTYAASRTQQSSHLLENLVNEHFEGRRWDEFYDIGRLLGEGSYGSVHMCKHKQTGDEFACKVISMAKINQNSLRKLHEEISILKSVDHPNIIKLREVFFGSKTVYLIMELSRGGELFEQITRKAPRGCTEGLAAKLMADMFSAVKYLHTHNIVHRDLKLENFLFEVACSEGMNSPLKLIDFGLSKHCDIHETMHSVVGSAYYMAPEVLAGNYDHRCDIWSLGVICYIILAGKPPFNGSSGENIFQNVAFSEPDYSSARFSHVRTTTIDFIRRLLVKDPDRRMSIDQAFEHPFLKNAEARSTERSHSMGSVDEGGSVEHRPRSSCPSMEVVSSLTRFMNLSRFKKLMLEAVAFSLTPDQIAVLRDEFQLFDTDRSGTITARECLRYLSKLGEQSTENGGEDEGRGQGENERHQGQREGRGQEKGAYQGSSSETQRNDDQGVRQNSAGSAGSHERSRCATRNTRAALALAREKYLVDSSDVQFNYHEFLAAAMCKRIEIDEERLILAFHTLDTEGKGYLDAAAIRRAMGSGASETEVHDMIESMDERHNGRINYIDFVKFWRSFAIQQALTPLQRLQSAVKKTVSLLRTVRTFGSLSSKPQSTQLPMPASAVTSLDTVVVAGSQNSQVPTEGNKNASLLPSPRPIFAQSNAMAIAPESASASMSVVSACELARMHSMAESVASEDINFLAPCSSSSSNSSSRRPINTSSLRSDGVEAGVGTLASPWLGESPGATTSTPFSALPEPVDDASMISPRAIAIASANHSHRDNNDDDDAEYTPSKLRRLNSLGTTKAAHEV